MYNNRDSNYNCYNEREVDIVIPRDKIMQNVQFNERLCNTLAELLKFEYDNVQRESLMTDDEIRKNRAAINDLVIPGYGYSKITLQVKLQCVNCAELIKLTLDDPFEPYKFTRYVYNHGYYTIADEVHSRVTIPYEHMKHTATPLEKIAFLGAAYENFDKFSNIVAALYWIVDESIAGTLKKNEYHVKIQNRIKDIFYEEVFKDAHEDLCKTVFEYYLTHRNDAQFDTNVIKNIINMYRSIGCPRLDPKEDECNINMYIYKNFEIEFIQRYCTHYKKEAITRISANGYNGYTEWSDTIITSTVNLLRNIHFTEYGTSDMQNMLAITMVEPYYNEMIYDSMYGVYAMMSRNDVRGVRQLYSCLDKLQKREDLYFNDMFNHTYTYDNQAIIKMYDEMWRFIDYELSIAVTRFKKGIVESDDDCAAVTLDTIITDVINKYSMHIGDDMLFNRCKKEMSAKYIAV